MSDRLWNDPYEWAHLDPADKVRIIEAMGFTPQYDPHQWDCPGNYAGNNCNCVPDPTFWSAPNDVLIHRGETWKGRLAKARGENP